MKDLTEKLWPAFLAEVTEHLESLELALVGKPASGITDINAIFRSFHTIKGGCAMMGFRSMEAIAHACEDILDPLRKGESVPTDDTVTLLLEALDRLKSQLAESAQSKREPSAAPDLLARLAALRGDPSAGASGATRGGARRNAKASRPAGATETPAPAASPAPVAATAPRTGSPAAFAALACTTLPLLADALLADAPASDDARAAAARLADAARDAAMPGLAACIARLVAGEEPGDRTGALGELLDRVAFLEETTGNDCGTRDAAAVARARLAPRFQAQLDRLAAAGANLARAAADVDTRRDVFAEAATACRQSIALALVLGLRATASLLRLAAQVLREAARGAVDPSRELSDLLAVAASLPVDLGEGCVEDEPYLAMCAQVRDRLREAAAASVHGGDAGDRVARIRDTLEIAPELLDALSAHALGMLEQSVARREPVVEIEADLEATPDFGQEFITWLTRNGTIINNHTVFHRDAGNVARAESTRLRFLVALRVGLEEARLVLGELDPQRRFYEMQPCRRLDEAPVAPQAGVQHAATEAGPAPAGAERAATGGTLRIDSTALDRFVDRVGELVTLRNALAHTLARDDLAARLRRARSQVAGDGATAALLAEVEASLEQLSQVDVRMQGALGRMQEDVLALRVVPVGTVFNRLPRTVRDLSRAQGKQVTLDISGEDVRIDKGMVDLLLEPLMHLVRNAIDHGIETPAQRAAAGKPETATLRLAARQQGGMLCLEVVDDGTGLDLARIRDRAIANGLLSAGDAAVAGERELSNLIFLPGFSTAREVTAVSGRGVGMDVVRTRVLQVGGQVEVQSRRGAGTTFTLKLPLSVAIQSVVHVAAGARQLALPDRHVLEILAVAPASLQSVQGQAACLLRGTTLPVYDLGELLGDGGRGNPGNSPGDSSGAGDNDTLEVVVLGDGTHRIGLAVSRVLGRIEVFVRDMHPDLARIPGVGGAAVLGDGRVVIILDCENLFDLALRRAQSLRSLLRAS